MFQVFRESFLIILILISKNLSLKYPLISQVEKFKNETSKKNLRKLNTTTLHSYDELYSTLSIPLCIGIPKQCFNLIYDTGEMYLIVSSPPLKNTNPFTKYFNATASETSTSNINNFITISYRNGGMQTREISDYIFLSEKRPSFTFSFLLSWQTNVNYNFDGILGLGFLYPERLEGNSFDLRFSFIDYLKKNNLIKNKIFGHEYYNRTHGTFYIDEIPPSMGDNYYKCKVETFIPFVTKWHCEMRSVSFSTGENFTDIHSPVAFSTGYIDVRGPFNEGLIIFDTLIKYSNGKCAIVDYSINNDRYSKIICDYNLNVKNIPNVVFNVKGFELVLKNDDLFRLVSMNGVNKYICKIIIDTRYNYWNLGEAVLKNYNMVFNYDDKTIGFKENINLIGESWITTIMLSCLLITVCSFAIWIYKNRKRLFLKEVKNEDFKDLESNEAFDSGKEMESNYESFEEKE